MTDDERHPDGASAEDGVPEWVPPMLAVTGRRGAFAGGSGWVYERKIDGLRCLAVLGGGRVELWSRNHRPYHDRFDRITAAIRTLPVGRIAVDGELAVIEGGRTTFAGLQGPAGSAAAVLCCFDLLDLDGTDTRPLPLLQRKALLARVLDGQSRLPVMGQVTGDSGALLDAACAAGWEGLMAKRAESPYRSGRSADWVKLKCTASQELVIGGWTEPSGSREGFGALLVGHFDDAGALRYAGRVGTGFDADALASLGATLRPLERPRPPFSDFPGLGGPGRLPTRGVHWVEPVLVAEVSFSEWTPDGRLRHPSFLGLRTDKAPTDVRRET